MTDRNIELTRRKILGAAGAIGIAGAGAGLGTSALFSDEESLTNNSITAGTLDMSVKAEIVAANQYWEDQGIIGDMETADGDAVVGLQAQDVKPGDWVIICFEIDIGDNPGYVRISTDDFAQYENGQTEPEIAAEGDDGASSGSLDTSLDGQGEGELQDELVAEVYGTYNSGIDSDPPRSYLEDPEPSLSGSARTVFEQFATGTVVGGPADPLEVGSGNDAIERYLLLELPADVGNEVQSDAIEFDLVFDAVQVRNNDGFEPSSSLVGYWPLNDVGTAPVEDLSGNGNDGTAQGDITSVGGQVANAAAFDGNDDYVAVSDNLSGEFDEGITIAAWVKTDVPADWRSIAALNDTSNGGNSPPALLRETNGGAWEFFVDTSDGSTVTDRVTGGTVTTDTWIHVVGTYDGSEVSLYLDGDKKAGKTQTGTLDAAVDGALVGAWQLGGNGDLIQHWDGDLDDVRVYDRALSSSEVTELYDATK